MTLSFSLTKSSETLSLAGAASSENTRKSAGSDGSDGFADLLGQLASLAPPVAPAGAEPAGALPHRQATDLPTGKVLPLAGSEFEVADFQSDAPVAATPVDGIVLLPGLVPGVITTGGAEPAPTTDLVPGTSAGANAAVPQALKPGGTEPPSNAVLLRGGAEPSPTADLVPGTSAGANAAVPQALKPGSTLPASVPGLTASELPVQGTEAAKPGFELRISAAPGPLAGNGTATAVENGMARLDLPGAPVTALRPATAAELGLTRAGASAKPPLTSLQPDALAESAGAEGEAALAAKPAAADGSAPAGKAERAELLATSRPVLAAGEADSAGKRGSTADQGDQGMGQNAGGARNGGVVDAARILANPLSPRGADAGHGFGSLVSASASAATPAGAVDAVGQVERVVEQLMAARQFDLSKPTAVALAHKEFGALTLTFGHSAEGMKVEIAAQDSEAQRALAAAMASDRGPQRQQDSIAAAASSQQGTAERGSTNAGNQSSTGFGQHTSDGQRSGDNSRSAHADPHARRGDTPVGQAQQGGAGTTDDALYA